jgi:hypothetical protein
MIEISGMINDKAKKIWLAENCWLPAINTYQEKYEYRELHFIELANGIRNRKNQLNEKDKPI